MPVGVDQSTMYKAVFLQRVLSSEKGEQIKSSWGDGMTLSLSLKDPRSYGQLTSSSSTPDKTNAMTHTANPPRHLPPRPSHWMDKDAYTFWSRAITIPVPFSHSNVEVHSMSQLNDTPQQIDFTPDHVLNRQKHDLMEQKLNAYFDTAVQRTSLLSQSVASLSSAAPLSAVPEKQPLISSFQSLIIRRCSRPVHFKMQRKCITGWDIIVPALYAAPVWKALVFAGGCAVGFEEYEHALRAFGGLLSFPRDFPDSGK
jgi:hypothetical protein